MMEAVGVRTEPKIEDVGEFKVHYHIAGGLHQMDAIARNKAEAELIALLRELSVAIDVPFQIETEARGEGGVVEYWNLVFQHKEQIAAVLGIVGWLVSTAPFVRAKVKQSKQQTELNELNIQKLKLELAEKEDAAADRAEKKRERKNGALPLEPPLTPEEIVKALLARKKIARRRSNYYEHLIEDSRVEAVGFSPTHRKGAQETIVQRGEFSGFVVTPTELEPIVYRNVPIEIVSPVLRSDGLKWRGVFDKRTISFDLEDRVFQGRSQI